MSKLGVSQRAELLNHTSSKIQIRFIDINQVNFKEFSTQYQLTLERVIADGICIFVLEKKQNQDNLILKIKNESSNIFSIKSYYKYHMRAY